MDRIQTVKLPRTFAVLAAILAVLLLGVFLLDPYGLEMAPGVTVGQVELGGMRVFSAARHLHQALEQSLYSQNLTLILPEETFTLSPEVSKPQVSVRQAVWDAYALGRWEEADSPDLSLANYLTVDEEAIRSILSDYASGHDTALTQTQWFLEGQQPELGTDTFDASLPCQELKVILGTPEAHLDIDAAYAAIEASLCGAVSACASRNYQLTVDVTPSALPEDVDADTIFQAVSIPAVNDSLDLENIGFVHGNYGTSFQKNTLGKMLEQAEYGDTLRIPMEYVAPEIMGDGVYFRDLLGSCETKHNDNENRNTNLRLLCAALDGFILQPGETFSYNGVVGERTTERGYKPAPAYSGYRLVDSVGGGVCQGSTTLYNCVLLADLEVVFRACHGASVGYVPRGLDAAVNYLTTDFQFRNNWNFPVQIRAEVSGGYVKMQIFGTDEKDYYIKMESRSGEDDIAIYARSYKCRYSKQTHELLSRDLEAYSTYYKSIG